MAKRKKLLKILCIVILIATIVGAVIFWIKGNEPNSTYVKTTTKEVTLGDINIK